MSKTIKSLLHEAELKWDMWREISDDPQALEDRMITREDAIILANYFEGRFDALCDARGLIESI